MDPQKMSLKYTELSSLRKIEAEFWIALEESLRQDARVEDAFLKPLVKMQKSQNNKLMKMINRISQECTVSADNALVSAQEAKTQPLMMDSVDEVEGFENVVQQQEQ